MTTETPVASEEQIEKKVLPWLDVRNCFTSEPPPLDFVLPGFLAGTVGGLVSPGGVGKSTWSLEACISIACEAAGGDMLGLDIKKHGRVVLLAAEDPDAALHYRLHNMGKHLSPAVRDQIFENLRISPCIGLGADLLSAAWSDTIEAAADGTRLVVIDTLSRFHCLDENSGADAKAIVAKMEAIARKSGASILYLHHVSKASAMGGMSDLQQAARGSSVFVDNARWLSFVAGMGSDEAKQYGISESDRKGYVRWNISKMNYGIPGGDRWYRRADGGVLLPAEIGTFTGSLPLADEPKERNSAKMVNGGNW